jgi:glycosyltransferase involved in cell wall biosynthesis
VKLAFYYHIPVYLNTEGQLTMSSHLGVFIEYLSREVEHLYLVMHQAKINEIYLCDYILSGTNITWINLGYKTPAWHRAIFHNKILKHKISNLTADIFLVRSPTPLAPYFNYYFPAEKIYFMIVGDYLSSIIHHTEFSVRRFLINIYLRYYTWLFYRSARKTAILVNSSELYEKYRKVAPKIDLIKTTTLSTADFFERDDTCQRNKKILLYTGRLDFQKGLKELILSTASLVQQGYPISLHVAGWEDDPGKPVEKELRIIAAKHQISDRVFFHGKKSVGESLNTMYRMADIYVFPSYHEGFPRTIWEAMANSLPVIATAIGAIPDYLTNETHALLIEPKSVQAISAAIIKLLDNTVLRKQIIANAKLLAKDNTLEIQTKEMVTILQHYVQNPRST